MSSNSTSGSRDGEEALSRTVDARGLLCPMPVIRTQQAIQDMQPQQLLKVIASDPGTLQDIPAWCRVHGHELHHSGEQEDIYTFIIRVVG